MSRVSLLVFEGSDPSVEWAVPATEVRRVTAAAEWSGDALTILGEDPDANAPRSRVLVLRTGIALRASSGMRLEELDASGLCPLPPLVKGHAARLARAIVLAEGRRPILVLDAARLLSHLDEAAT